MKNIEEKNKTNEMSIWKNVDIKPFLPSDNKQKTTVLIIGAGPVGLAMSIEIGKGGHDVILINKRSFISKESKAICFSQRTLDIFNSYDVAGDLVQKGITWDTGKVYFKNMLLYAFKTKNNTTQHFPSFINIPQYIVEDELLKKTLTFKNIDVRYGHELISLSTNGNINNATIKINNYDYTIMPDWIIACDGSRSTTRSLLGLDFQGDTFEDIFLIVDIETDEELPRERSFWFDPPFNPGKTVLMHRQPDNIWRIDFQIGNDISRDEALSDNFIKKLINCAVGHTFNYKIIWRSLYKFNCRRMERFVHNNIIFVGDSAHLVSPFGARGCNGGIADAHNLGWKINLILNKKASRKILESYNDEAIEMSDENIANSTRSINFITPQSSLELGFRNAILELASTEKFAQCFVNTGRLAVAVEIKKNAFNIDDTEKWNADLRPGKIALNAPLNDSWLLDEINDQFTVLTRNTHIKTCDKYQVIILNPINHEHLEIIEAYQIGATSVYLLRPDGYIAARWYDLANTDIINSTITNFLGGNDEK